MSANPAGLLAWLNSLPKAETFPLISTPRYFAHDESQYDAQYQCDPANLQVGRGLLTLLKECGADCASPAVEIGCGTGLLSLGLAADNPYPHVLITDPSPSFLKITQKKLRVQGLDEARVAFAVLTGEEIDRLPADSFSLVALRSTLHHILDVEEFIRRSARVLRPGGVLAFQEPSLDGYLLMGAVLQFLPLLLKAAKQKLSKAHHSKIEEFVHAMSFYARRDLDKSQAEDKHLFRVDEVMRLGASCGLSVEFRPNVGFEAFSFPPQSRPKPEGFTSFLRSYARYCMSWEPPLIQMLDEHLVPFCQYVEQASGGGSGPYLHGVFVCRKT